MEFWTIILALVAGGLCGGGLCALKWKRRLRKEGDLLRRDLPRMLARTVRETRNVQPEPDAGRADEAR